MSNPKRGAARVSAVWLITVLVLFFAAMVFGFVAYDDRSAALEARAAAEEGRLAAEAVTDELRAKSRDISRAAGWYDPQAPNPETDVQAAKADLARLQAKFPGTEGARDFAEITPTLVSAYDTVTQEAAALGARVQSLQSELEAAREAQRGVTSAKDREISDLRRQLADEAAAGQRRIDDLEQQIAQTRSQNSDLDARMRSLERESADQTLASAREKDQLQNQIRVQASKLDFLQPGKRELPDGTLVQVSDALGLGFIDIGAEQRLIPGVRFRVESGPAGRRRVKGFAEVVEVEPKQAKVSFYDVVDRYDPFTPGDVLINELFDPTGERTAILAGRFDGKYNEKQVVSLLEKIGVKVLPAERMDRTVDFLIVGSELWHDPELGDMLEEPIQPSELAVYKQAESLSVTILPLKRIREYFTL